MSEAELTKQQTALQTLSNLKEINAPQRKYIRKDMDKIADKQTKIQSTLLEYGLQNVLLSNIASQQDQQKHQQNSAAAKMISPLKQESNQQQQANLEEANLIRLINEMSEADNKHNKVTANAIGQILGLQQSTLQQIVSEYTYKETELQNDIEYLEKLVGSGDGAGGGFQHKQRLIYFLNKQIEQKESAINEKQAEIEGIRGDFEKSNEKLRSVNKIDENYSSNYFIEFFFT